MSRMGAETVRRTAAGALVALVGAVGLTACSPDEPEPQPVADAFAADLADGTFDGAPVADPDLAAEQLATLLGDLAEAPREVTAGAVTEIDPQDAPDDLDPAAVRDVSLTWTIDLGEGIEPVEISSTARLELVEDDGEQRWTALWEPAVLHPDADEGSALAVSRTPAERAEVLGHDGQVLVEERPVLRIGIDKQNLDPAEHADAARTLGEELALDDVAGFVQRVADAGPQAFVVALTVRQSESETYGVDALRALPGVLVQDAFMILPPTSGFARPVLGTVGDATAEIVEESEGAIAAGDVVGLSGLQRLYDAQLRGTPGLDVVLTAGTGGDVQLHSTDPVPGEPLVTTLDTTLQSYAEARLADVGSASAVVVLQASTGEVLAAASGPAGGGLSTATVGQYAPGSTFKVATALALLRAGLTAESPVACTPTAVVDGYAFENYPGYPTGSVGTIPLAEAIAQSCNTALIAEREQVSAADVADAAAALGIGAALPADSNWPFPYYPGTVPADAEGTTHAADLIGQGGVLVSPVAMAGLAASVAAGRTTTPVLVEADNVATPEAPSSPLTSAEATQLAELMYGVVDSGTSTFLQDVAGAPVAAKSGTAQYGEGDPPATHAWMVAFQGDLAVSVFVEEGDYGTETAGPILEDVLTVAGDGDWGTAG